MELKPIKNKRDYQAALKQVEALWDAPLRSPAGDALDVLTLLIADYEAQHEPIAPPDPIDFLHYVMDTRGLTRRDLEPYIGARNRVSEVLNRVRPLSLEMIRRLADGLKLPANVLIQPYELARQAA